MPVRIYDVHRRPLDPADPGGAYELVAWLPQGAVLWYVLERFDPRVPFALAAHIDARRRLKRRRFTLVAEGADPPPGAALVDSVVDIPWDDIFGQSLGMALLYDLGEDDGDPVPDGGDGYP